MTDAFDPTEAVGDTRGRAGFVRTASWATAFNGGQQFFTVIVGFVLAGIVGPSAYGVLAIALAYIAFLEMMQRQGLVVAVVQRPNLTTSDANAAFWFVMALSTILTVISIALAGWWAGLNDIPELRGVIIALSLMLPLKGLNVVQEALLRRRMRFRALTVRTTSAVVAGGVVGVVGALEGWGVWALVAQQLVTAAWSTVALWVVSGWRPGVRFTWESLRGLLGFSAGTFLSSLGLFLNGRADVLLLGFFLGPVTVGLYRLAARLVEAVLSLSGNSAVSMALPELSPFRSERDEFVRRGRRLSKMAGALALPILGVMLGSANAIIAPLGPEWDAAAQGLRWLCLYGAIRTLVTLNGPLLMALGRTYLQAAFTWSMAIVSVAVLAVTAVNVASADESQQVAAIAASRALAFGPVMLVAHLMVLARVVEIPPREALNPFGSSAIAGLSGAGVAFGLTWLLRDTEGPILVALVVCGMGGAVAFTVLTAIDPAAREMLRGVGRRLRLRSRT